MNDPYKFSAGVYDRIFERINAGVFSLSMKMLAPKKGLVALDIGCGTGAFVQKLLESDLHVFAVDLSPAMLRVANSKFGSRASLQLADASKLPFASTQFDLITSSLMIHEMSPSIRDALINEMKRVLKPEGHILIVDFHSGSLNFPQGWFNKVFILISEILAGPEHFRNYRQFMSNGGIPQLCSQHNIKIETERVISGGNMAIFITRLT